MCTCPRLAVAEWPGRTRACRSREGDGVGASMHTAGSASLREPLLLGPREAGLPCHGGVAAACGRVLTPGNPPSLCPAALRRELEDVTREHSESRRQSEKDRGALLAQTEVLEAELEEQLARHRACAEQTAELSTLRQQLASLDKHLRGQRHFMDVSVLCGPWRRSLPALRSRILVPRPPTRAARRALCGALRLLSCTGPAVPSPGGTCAGAGMYRGPSEAPDLVRRHLPFCGSPPEGAGK